MKLRYFYIGKSIGTIERARDGCRLANKKYQYAINESDQEEELKQGKPDGWKMIWPKWNMNEKRKQSIDQHKDNWVLNCLKRGSNETSTANQRFK